MNTRNIRAVRQATPPLHWRLTIRNAAAVAWPTRLLLVLLLSAGFIGAAKPAQAAPAEPDASPVTRLVIPSLKVEAEVVYAPFDGTTWPLNGLGKKVAWLGETSGPGLGSNTVLAGHVTVRGLGKGPFYRLKKLKADDEIIVYTERNRYTYTVREKKIVAPNEIEVILPTVDPQLTLITCTDWDAATRRYLRRLVVVADLVRVEALPLGGEN